MCPPWGIYLTSVRAGACVQNVFGREGPVRLRASLYGPQSCFCAVFGLRFFSLLCFLELLTFPFLVIAVFESYFFCHQKTLTLCWLEQDLLL